VNPGESFKNNRQNDNEYRYCRNKNRYRPKRDWLLLISLSNQNAKADQNYRDVNKNQYPTQKEVAKPFFLRLTMIKHKIKNDQNRNCGYNTIRYSSDRNLLQLFNSIHCFNHHSLNIEPDRDI